ncbi:MAG: alpha/beta hydrolase [Parvibaculum sp.]|uniref:alpha/beta hydrolase n=1 Tax=Parvibaculum sp. TaxID=2024848 RepID=UPI0032EC7065
MYGDFGSDLRSGSEGRTVMLVHGMWSRPHVWDNFRTFFEARGYRVVVPALRHRAEPGADPHPELGVTSIADYADDLAAEIRNLGHKPVIIGHSMGGLLAQILAARDLVHAAVCLASAHCAGYMSFDPGPLWIFRKQTLSSRFWERPQLPSLDTMSYGVLNGLPPAERDAVYGTLVPESGRAFFEIAYWFFDRRRATTVNPADVSCPLLMLTGVDDRLTPAHMTKRVVEGYAGRAMLETLPGHAHWLPAEPGWERIAERTAAFFEAEAPVLARQIPVPVPAPAGDLVPVR